jgi:hypothetical protein
MSISTTCQASPIPEPEIQLSLLRTKSRKASPKRRRQFKEIPMRSKDTTKAPNGSYLPYLENKKMSIAN